MNNSISKSPQCSFQARVTVSRTTCDFSLSFLTHWNVRFFCFFTRTLVILHCGLFLWAVTFTVKEPFLHFIPAMAGHGRWNGASLSGLDVAGLIHDFKCRLSAFSREKKLSRCPVWLFSSVSELSDSPSESKMWPVTLLKNRPTSRGLKSADLWEMLYYCVLDSAPMTRKFCMFFEWETTSHSKPPALSPTATHCSGISPVRNSPSGPQIVKAAIKPRNLLIPLFPPLISQQPPRCSGSYLL